MNNENFDLVTSDENEEFTVEFGEVINDGGTFNYNELQNKPKINGNTLEGDKTTSELGIPVYSAGDNITISDDHVISATGTTYTDFTGATASTDGAQGLVPGPLAGDEDKFLKADGTWGEIAIDGQVTTLTADDYNWNRTAGDDTTLPLDSIALWKLAPGWYRTDIGMQVLRYKTTDYSYCPKDVFILVLGDATSGPATTRPNYVFRDGGVSVALPRKNTGVLFEKTADKSVAFTSILGEMYQVGTKDYDWNSQTQTQTDPDCFALWRYSLDTHPKTITNSFTNVQIQEYKGGPLVNGAKSPVYLRSMRVGSNPINMFKVDSDGAYRITTGSGGNLLAYETLATIDAIDNRILTNAGAPTTSTVGTVGQILEDTTNGKLYICTDATNPYVWEEVGSGGGISDYEDLDNLPKVNNVTLTGNKSLSDLGIQPAGDYALESEIPDVSNFITKSVDDLVNYYKKSETFTKQEVNNLISAITTLDIRVVQTLPTEDISTTTIYLVPKTTAEANNAYDEYIYVSNAWEHIGNTEVDLTDYVKNTDYATSSNSGVFKVSNGVMIGSTGYISCNPRTYADYTGLSNSYFIAKGTLENVLTGKGLVSNTDYATYSNGGVIKVDGAFSTFITDGKLKCTLKTYGDYQNLSSYAFIGKGTLENVVAGKELDLKQLSTFDSTKTQVLKNINGTLTWVDES